MRANSRYNLKFSGQSMIEVVIGLAITTLLAVALVTTSIYTQKTSRSAKNEAQASKLAQELIEQARIFRDRVPSGFAALPSSAGCYTLNSSGADPATWSFSSALSPCNSPPPVVVPSGAESVILDNVTFARWVQIPATTGIRRQLRVIVSWSDSGGTHYVTNETFLANWCGGQVVVSSTPCPSP